MSNDQITIIRHQRGQIARKCIVLKLHSVILLIRKGKISILNIQGRCSISSSKYWSATLTRKLTDEHIILYAFYYNHHATFNSFLFLECHICPSLRIDELFHALLERSKYRFVGSLYLFRIDADVAFQFLCPQRYTHSH